MNIGGWAFKENGDEIRDKRYRRYKELNKEDFEILNIRNGYAQKEYEVVVKNKDLSYLDMLLYCDSGNTCFGGCVGSSSKTDEQGNSIYLVTVYTD